MANLFFSGSTAEAKKYAQAVQKGELTRIRRGIYTDAPFEDIPQLLNSRWYEVVAYLFGTKSLVAFRTACELKPSDGVVFIVDHVSKRRRVVVGAGLIIDVLPGNPNQGREPFLAGLSRSNLARQCLENLVLSRSSARVVKSLGAEYVEQQLCKELGRGGVQRLDGEQRLNQLRDEARQIAQVIGLEREADQLSKMISALLTTYSPDDILTTRLAVATARKEPYDPYRIELFTGLVSYLDRCDLDEIPYEYQSRGWQNLAFFESYFSNYIEGTEFELDEAESIVFSREAINNRHEDSHDIMAVYDLVNDYQEMMVTPATAEELLHLLTMRHALMMNHRPDKRPGLFKEKSNKAGDTLFVKPEELQGTLSQGFELLKSLPAGLKRAIFMQYLVSECHPFDDGNGRLSRIMMNAELHSAGLYKLIIPTVHRDSYLNGLRQASRQGKFRAITKVFHQMHLYAASRVDWLDYGDARQTLENHGADKIPDVGIGPFNQILRHLGGVYPP
jgi:hypothetical protein